MVAGPFFVLVETCNRLGLLLDEVLFRAYRTINVSSPVFIIGVPRSGTTFLHRLMARDSENFTSLKLWEIAFAPSILQKKVLLCLGAIDRLFGSPIASLITRIEEKLLADFNIMHRISLFEPEEDGMLLIHVFCSSYVSFVFPFAEDLKPYWYFDDMVPETERERIMDFYRRCLQRHLYVFGRGKRILSKNPVFCPKVQSLCRTFPDARILYLARTPLDTVPSMLSLFGYLFDVFESKEAADAMRDDVLAMIHHWYLYPPAQLSALPAHRKMTVIYDDLVADPHKVVCSLYDAFSIPLSDGYARVLQGETDKAGKYKSRHAYSLEQAGMSVEGIQKTYRDVFLHFGFPAAGEEDTPVV